MKAKTFIEYWKSPITEVMSIHKAYDLLSRPFKPEDITELFEGWEKLQWAKGLYQCKGKSQAYSQNGKMIYDKMGDDFKLWRERCQTITPNTINQFISDCTRSGIELFWKDSIVKEYFK